ncbi:MAG: STAS domain-containing protein [Chitinispirillaceae bacterium]|nr:STAS domain-containing protein [Chitinispirillaceae bacterium]
MSIKIHVKKHGKIQVLEIIGELTGDQVGKIAVRLERMRKSTGQTIAVDLSRTTFIDSHGLGAFVYSWRLLENEHRDLVFVSPRGFILNMLRNTNLDRVFRIVNSVEEL